MNTARRSAPDAPTVWYRRLIRRTTRQRPPSAAALPPRLKRWELITLVSAALLVLLVVIAAAGAVSYSHMHDWAKANGEEPWRAILSPIPVDGAILAGSIVIFVDARLRNRPDLFAYLVVGVSIAWSVVANIAHDWVDHVAAKLIAGWPPVALAATVELTLRLTRRLRERADTTVEPQPEGEPVGDAVRGNEVAPEPEPLPRSLAVVETAAPEPVTVAPAIEPEPEPEPEPVADATESEVDSLTEDMHEVDWAPGKYRTAGAAMRAYLEKVDPDLSGAELWTRVAVRYFGATGADTGTGRRIVQAFKADRARAAERSATGPGGKE